MAPTNLTERVASQFHHPRGVGGRVAGWIMGTRPSNVRRNAWAVERLPIVPGDQVLEIGFGPGVAVEALAARVGHGVVHGIDHSELMWRTAGRRNAGAADEGRVRLDVASVDDLPSDLPPLDAVYTMNTVLFWPEPRRRLQELRRLLRPGGTILLGHQPRNPGADESATRRSGEELAELLRTAGFVEVRVEVGEEFRPPVVAVVAERAP